MKDMESSDYSSDSEYSGSDAELQEAFTSGLVKPGLNIVEEKKVHTNNVNGLKQKMKEFLLDLEWLERLDFVNKEAPLAPEMAANMLEREQKRENELKNNMKLKQYAQSDDPVLNDFKREMTFYRQAQATVMKAIPMLKMKGIPTKRPDDYFAEMAKTDAHMQKIREKLSQRQMQQQRSEKVKQLRIHRKEGKMLQVQAKLERQQEKKQMLDQVKKVRKGLTKDTKFLDMKNKNPGKLSRKALQKRHTKDKKFGFGGQKRHLKKNTAESSSDISEYKRPNKFGGKSGRKVGKNQSKSNKRVGKNRRKSNKNRSR